jgi:(1->4)-alpha-D-glucan 1-alpha-D-glucosylmutase
MTQFRIPDATYRLQFHGGFRYGEAAEIVDYLREIGISDVYSSPIFTPVRGSQHGYDVVDPTRINPGSGGEEEFARFSDRLREEGMGLLVDIVPNHMAASSDNRWWMTVLENGPQSRYAKFFDIEWRSFSLPPGLERKIVLPILGRPYGEALEEQEIRLEESDEGIYVTYYDKKLPLSAESYLGLIEEVVERIRSSDAEPNAPAHELCDIADGARRAQLADTYPGAAPNTRFLRQTLMRLYTSDASFRELIAATVASYNGTKGDPKSFDKLDALLDRQWYRLAYWKRATEQINYRRFFDIIDLVGVRVEDPEVFEKRHERLLELVADGRITGLRIDHIDGLHDPVAHLRKLQRRIAGNRVTAAEKHPFYIVVEKILARDEQLPDEFACDGTTGYDFLNRSGEIFVDPEGLRTLDTTYRSFTLADEPFEELAYRLQRETIQNLFTSEMRRLAIQLEELAAGNRKARDFSPADLGDALTEVTASLPIYRTYVRGSAISERDRRYIEDAIDAARSRSGPRIDPRIYAFLRRVLLVDPPHYAEAHRDEWLAFVLRWQQFTGRVMAKGVEDTAFYVYNRLISLNEVGGEPGAGLENAVEALHEYNAHVARQWPHTLSATSTHDTKRSEDMRARLHVLSELAGEWNRLVARWREENRFFKKDVQGVLTPDPNEELLIYQTIAGVWPLEEAEGGSLGERLRLYVEKAAREAKVYSSWLQPHADHEAALLEFTTALLDPSHEEFHRELRPLVDKISYYGFLNALSQLVLKITSPGVPDFYQGTELWDFSLVDPDNRRPVDYERRRAVLREIVTRGSEPLPLCSELLASWRDGRVKMYVTARLLRFRREASALFSRGDYTPAATGGKLKDNVFAFRRSFEEEEIAVAVTRLLTRCVEPGELPLGEVWGDTALDTGSGRWENVLTGESLDSDGRVRAADVFRSFPVAVLRRH